ncbi:MAG: triosephosphate isomerase [Acidithiobacillales bacterium SG8_45]|nr:MAG: triosephosphate isomerase [Acidithiobacillales bacterium SG8_45]
MRNFLVAGNWKMHGDDASNRELVAGIIEGAPAADNVSLLVCPPFPYLASVASQLQGSVVELGAQNVSEHEAGAYTGEVAPAMLRDLGCRYVIVGHSERRALYGESSVQVAEKMAAALGAGLVPILCVGEMLEEREAGRTEEVVGKQLAAALERNGIAAFKGAVIAYEPVWAIGTGKTATPEQAQDVHRYIRSVLAEQDASVAETVQILYGGSVKGDNAAGLFAMPDIDGGLIGGASLKPADFLAIARAAAEI